MTRAHGWRRPVRRRGRVFRALNDTDTHAVGRRATGPPGRTAGSLRPPGTEGERAGRRRHDRRIGRLHEDRRQVHNGSGSGRTVRLRETRTVEPTPLRCRTDGRLVGSSGICRPGIMPRALMTGGCRWTIIVAKRPPKDVAEISPTSQHRKS